MKISKKHLLFTLVAIAAIGFGAKHLTPRLRHMVQEYRKDQFPAENNGWKKYGNAPVFGQGENTMFDPYCFIENDSINMLVSDRKNGSLILVKSIDGIHWENPQTLLTGNADSWESIVNRGGLIHHNDKYFLYYTGQDCANKYLGRIGLAVSDDGKSFTKVSQKPILKPELSFEGETVMNPCVIFDDDANIFKMWYSAGETYEPNVICYAESADGINWTKRKRPVLEEGDATWEQNRLGGCQVIKDASGYTMYYIGYQNIDLARICYATSKDGITWTRPQNNLLLSPSRDSWDSEAVYKPTVITWKGKQLLFYNGRNNCGEYVGLAIKQ